MRLSARLAAFALAIATGSAMWHALAAPTQDAHDSAALVTTTNSNVAAETPRRAARARGEEAREAGAASDAAAAVVTADTAGASAADEPPALRWSEEMQQPWGTARVTRVTLREGSAADSAVVARLRLPAYDSAEILDWTRDRLKVKFAANKDVEGGTRERDYVGWADWGAFKPGSLALVLDSESGEVVARVPLASNVSAATFSPDGRRVLFHGEGSAVAYEASTKDYRPARTLEASATGGFGRFFYGADGELRVPLWRVSYDDSGTVAQQDLEIMSVGRGAEPARARAEPKAASKFLVAPEGSVAVVVRAESVADAWGATGGGDASLRRAHVEVLDLDTLEARNTFALYGADAPDEAGEIALSRDGTRLYVKASAEGAGVVVIDTRSGVREREIPLGESARWSTLPTSTVGESFLMSVWDENGEQGSVWLGGEKAVAAEPGIDHAVETNGARYAINSQGTQLLKLDEKNRVRERIKIERPDLGTAADADPDAELVVYGVTASPDGKHLIIFVGTPECGC